MKHVVVLIPGVMGSVLKLGQDEIWPGPVRSLVLPYRKMKELMREDLVASDCIRSFVFKQYQALIEDLAICDFHEADKTLVVAAYDWRSSIDRSAETLALHLEKAFDHHAGDLDISLVAHSMGGLVARCYLESGLFMGRRGFDRVRRLITIGTPHRGAAMALPLTLGLEKRLFLSADQVLRLTSDPRYPGAYQLLPHAAEAFAWDGRDEQLPVANIYDHDVRVALGLVAGNLSAANAFHQLLDHTKRPAAVRYFCFAGNRQQTASLVRLQPGSGGRLNANKVEQEDAGDGTVPIWSSTLPGVQFLYVSGEHGTLYKSDELRKVLASLLGRPGVLAVVANFELAVRDKVTDPQEIVHLTITFPAQTTQLEGELAVERTLDPEAGEAAQWERVSADALSYRGVTAETLGVEIVAPSIRGYYRVALYLSGSETAAAYDELIVQEPPLPADGR